MKKLERIRKIHPVQMPAAVPVSSPLVDPAPNLGIPPAASNELFQKRWFCVGLYPSGKTFKQDADSPIPFLEIMNRSLVSWVDYISDDPFKDIPMVAAQMGFSEAFIASLSTESYLSYQDFDTEMWMKLPSIQIRGVDVQDHPLLILVRRNFVFTLHVSLVDKRFIRLRRYSDTILKKISLEVSSGNRLTILLTRIIDANNDSNFRHLRVIEERGDDLNESLMSTQADRAKLGPKIYEMKHALINYMNALWDSVDVLHALRYGDADLLSDEANLLNMINIMADEVKSQIGLAEHMSEVLASGLEVMQSIYNNQLQMLNNRLSTVITYLTIVGTAVLVPNTLATILGNTVFNIGPDDLWWYIILMVVSTAGASFSMWWWLKKMGWLPRHSDK